jgi:peptidoglycan/LPS O-acetylase OafA/YrhL
MVFFHHLPLHLQPRFLIGWQLSFYTGVTLFFVLSGFLISWRYYGKVEASGRYVWNYFINRFARIYPVYFLVLTLVVLLLKNFDPVFLLQNYTLTHTLFFIFPSHGVAIDPSWSLTVEECFYILAPFIFFLAKRFGLWLPFLLTAILLLLILFTYHDETPFSQRLFAVMTASFFGYGVAFFAGIYLALFLIKKKEPTPLKTSGYTLAGIAGLAILFIPLIYVTNKQTSVQLPAMLVCNNLLFPFPVALLYYGLVREKSWCRNILSTKAMRLAGRSSYAFYLIHFPLIEYLADPFIKPYFSPGHYNLYVMTVFILTLFISVIVFLYFEHPLNGWIRKNLKNT